MINLTLHESLVEGELTIGVPEAYARGHINGAALVRQPAPWHRVKRKLAPMHGQGYSSPRSPGTRRIRDGISER